MPSKVRIDGDTDKIRGVERPLLQRVVGSRGLRIEVDEASAHWFTAPSGRVPRRPLPRPSTSTDSENVDSAIAAFRETLSLRETSPPPLMSVNPESGKSLAAFCPSQPEGSGCQSPLIAAGELATSYKSSNTTSDSPQSKLLPLDNATLPTRTVV